MTAGLDHLATLNRCKNIPLNYRDPNFQHALSIGWLKLE